MTAPSTPGTDSPGKCITVYSLGDSRNIATWSNVPYFFTTTLERLGYRVNRVDIGPNRWLAKAYDAVVGSGLWVLGSRGKHDYFRSRLYQSMMDRKIRNEVHQRPNDHHVFLTFSFGAAHVPVPYVVFGDMTLERHIRYFEERGANALERRQVQREHEILEGSQRIVSLFPALAEELKGAFGGKVRYYGNVVNLDPPGMDEERLLARKLASREFVFIGKPAYKQGLLALLEAVELLNASGTTDFKVNVIGMDRKDVLRQVPGNVQLHGYLDKSVPAQYRTYLEILRTARAFINPNPKWAAFSASCEAMFMYSPVILFPYQEFQTTFGNSRPLGQFLRTDDPMELVEAMRTYLEDTARWREHAVNANAATRDFTWERYVRSFIADLHEV